MNKLIYILVLILISACATIREKAGLVKDQPDEYQVTSNPPLSVPPDLTDVQSPEELAQNRSNDIKTTNKNLSKGENIILQNLNK